MNSVEEVVIRAGSTTNIVPRNNSLWRGSISSVPARSVLEVPLRVMIVGDPDHARSRVQQGDHVQCDAKGDGQKMVMGWMRASPLDASEASVRD